MKLHFLGTCSGTEPMPGRHHLSWVLERKGKLYWFDAGESCSHTAHVLGLPLQSIRAIFISHSHMDHVGGLGNLLWTIRKLDGVQPREKHGRIDVFMPVLQTWEGTMMTLHHTEGSFAKLFEIRAHQTRPGIVFEEDGITVEAMENAHQPPGKSMSYRILVDGKKIVFSGDVRGIEEMEAWFDDCDLLLMETGHHKVEQVCRYVSERPSIKHLAFIHHGREILADPAGCLTLAQQFLQDRVTITNDGDSMEL